MILKTENNKQTITDLSMRKHELEQEIRSLEDAIHELEVGSKCSLGDHLEVTISYNKNSETISFFCNVHKRILSQDDARIQFKNIIKKESWIIPF